MRRGIPVRRGPAPRRGRRSVERLDRFVGVEPAAAGGRTAAASTGVAADFPRWTAAQVRIARHPAAAWWLVAIELARRACPGAVTGRLGDVVQWRPWPTGARRCRRTPTGPSF